MEAEGETAIFDRADLRKFEDYVAANYKEFYGGKAGYEVKKENDNFLVLFDNPSITMEEILLDINS
jgi:hypothetical protein